MQAMEEERKVTLLREAEARESAERQLRLLHPVAALPTHLAKTSQASETGALLCDESDLDVNVDDIDEEEDGQQQIVIDADATISSKKPRRRLPGRKLRIRP